MSKRIIGISNAGSEGIGLAAWVHACKRATAVTESDEQLE
jgi:hypothetical protein